MRRVGRPGLIGLAARTAVVAGTAGAVSGHQQKKAQAKSQAAYEQEQYQAAQQQAAIQAAAQQAVAAQTAAQQAAAPAAPAPAPAAASAPAGGVDVVAELQKLGTLKESGLLTDEEFAAAKAKLLG